MLSSLLKSIIPILFCFLSSPAIALELFGVNLESTNSGELRNAAKQAGVVLVKESGDDTWFDVYDSSTVLEGSTLLYLGFVKNSQQFAFAEYEFPGVDTRLLLAKLTRKYGKAAISAGRFISDKRYRWDQDGIAIELRSEWQNYKTHIIYRNPVVFAELLQERLSVIDTPAAKPEVSIF
ncbi:MAG: hypothetical protein ACI9LO_000567 [Planctomycetota bacterium]|jgi:hypothetical protein